MRFIARAACLPALLILANCAATPAPEDLSRAAPDPAPAAIAPPPGDIACLAEAIYFEARGTGSKGTEAVAHVVMNRSKSPKFPNSVCAVVGDGCQFSYRCDGRPDVLAEAGSRRHAYQTAERILAGAPDITNGALFFHSARARPGWFSTRQRVGTFGGNVFYR